MIVTAIWQKSIIGNSHEGFIISLPPKIESLAPASRVFCPEVLIFGSPLLPQLGHITDLHILWQGFAADIICKSSTHYLSLIQAPAL
jgi:hypothetical protein